MGLMKSISLFLSGDESKAKETMEVVEKKIMEEEIAMVFERLAGGLDVLYQDSVLPEEKVRVRLQGCMGEALVITDKRVIILKAGYPAGSIFARTCKTYDFSIITSLGYSCGFDKGLVQVVGEKVPEDNDSIERMRKAENCVNFPADKSIKFRKAIEILNEYVDIKKPEEEYYSEEENNE